MYSYERLLVENALWASSKLKEDPEFFKSLSELQSPEFLWIGCSDSRVPANEITGTKPGEIFVHRNVANLVIHTDLNLLTVLDYAVRILKVKHIIVCGHYGCGGVLAALTRNNFGIINKWIRNIKDVYKMHKTELDLIPQDELRADKLVEYNVIEQVINLAKTSIVQKAWKEEQRPNLHGWVYGLKDGIINPIFEMPANSKMDPLYEFDDL
ncbi:MAG: carbonate dehydratase [Saprospiraceae bacterium]